MYNMMEALAQQSYGLLINSENDALVALIVTIAIVVFILAAMVTSLVRSRSKA